MSYQLYGCISGVSDLSVFVWFQFDVVDGGVDWDVVQWQGVVGFDWGV